MSEQSIVLYGNGFSANLWRRRLGAAGLQYLALPGASENAAGAEADVIIETEDTFGADPIGDDPEGGAEVAGEAGKEPGDGPHGGNGHGSSLADREIQLAADGVVFAPCYSASPTAVTAEYEGWEANAVGYTLFATPEGRGAEAPIVEIARPMQASDETWRRALEFIGRIGFKAEIVGDAPGLVFGRTVACLINEAAYALGEGIATAEDIDTAMRLGVNYPKGLFEWADELGLDLILAILDGLYAHYQEDRYRPAPLMGQMLIAGRKFHER